MAFCTNCGAQVSDGTKFCPGCGQKIGGNEPATPVAPMREAPAQSVQTEEAAQAETPAQGAYQATYTPPAAQQRYTPPAQQGYTPPAQQSYTPPTQQGYTSPAQQSYTPPTQQGYTSPAQQSYAPPAQQSYQASQGTQPAYAPAAKAPKQKRPLNLNKKTLFIIGGAALAVILAVVLILVLGGKGNTPEASNDPNVGVWNATNASMWGMDMAVADVFENGVSLELKDNGKCVLTVDGDSANGKWSYEDGVLSLTGGGVDCTGTIESGVLSLTNLMDMGVDLTFEKEGGFVAGGSGAGNIGSSAAGEPGAAGASQLQAQWNGTWYGCLYVSDATGDFAGVPSDFYDAYMVVDVDSAGKGQFSVYLTGTDEAFAVANCEAKDSGLYAVDGTVAGGIEMYAYNWMFLPMPDYPDQYTMGDVIEDGDSTFEFTLFMKQWGGSWQKEIDSDFAIVPPSVDSYNAAIANGELPPIGFAPVGYEGTAAPSSLGGNSADSDEGQDDQTEPQQTGGDYGQSEADADGIVSLDTLIATGKYCDEHRTEVTYGDVYDMMGYVHGLPMTDSANWREGNGHMYQWSAPTGEYIAINFKVADNGYEYWSSMSYTSGLLK